ncbi:MAG: efflux RND transporter permease subunit [Deltaproteobacteria bacterium]|nr:efflux RND transporter permease subunit [Deltaproteobacteria bacterium]
MFARLVQGSARHPYLVGGATLLLLAGGTFAALRLPIDAVPDVSTVQVSVLTEAAGLSPPEVEQSVTFPIETALNGVPGLVELRSVSRPGLSAVTAVFRDGTNVWFARQLVLERLRETQETLPPGASVPQLAPVSTGLGEIFQFVVRSPLHSPRQLRTTLEWEIVPKLRAVPGVIEVNAMGGDLKQYEVRLDHSRLFAHHLTIGEVRRALSSANLNAGGGYVERGSETLVIRGLGRLANESDVGKAVVKSEPGRPPVLVRHLGEVRVGAALRHGVVTRDGEGEVVTGVVMMLLGANSREVVTRVKQKLAEVQRELPRGVMIDTVYDRADFIGRTLGTVMRNLVEGALVVGVVLWLLLGTLRGALVVVLGIPASMTFALAGMHLFGVTGDLMSLGAIDFGFLVDGPIVVLEALVGILAGRKLSRELCADAYGAATARVIRPVVLSVAIIMLVYLPLLLLEGVEGKMFRPMAVTMASALFGAVVYCVLFFPGLLVLLVPPPKRHGPAWLGWLDRCYAAWLPGLLRHRWGLAAAGASCTTVAVAAVAALGADFVPRIDEGDAVVTIRRAPSINLTQARELDLATERVLKRFPEVRTTIGMTGRAEIAYDPVGYDNTDMLVKLRPKAEWRTARDLDGLSEVLKRSIEAEVPGTFVSVSQPIEDRTNELLSGSRADVAIQLFGPDLLSLKQLAERVGAVARRVPGAGDVRVERLLGLPSLVVHPDRARLAQHGVKVEDLFATVEAARVGLKVGSIYEGQRRFDLRLLTPVGSRPEDLAALPIEAADGRPIPLGEVARLEETDGPAQVRRENLERTVRVEVNLRGRDLVSWVREAQTTLAREAPLPSGYRVTWGGQFENFDRASRRLAGVSVIAALIIFGMLVVIFGNVRYALAVFGLVPLALAGGVLGLGVRGMTFSIPAAVGFIALGGIAVLNGVVTASAVRERIAAGASLAEGVALGARDTLRAVITTAAVAALGFLPMASSTGAGSEVQRPLATVVIFGIAFSLLLSVTVFPGVLRIFLETRDARPTASADAPRIDSDAPRP